jgi:membrane associated rhomboid family serine protease
MSDWTAGPPDARAVLERAQELAEQGEYEQAAAHYVRVVGNGEPLFHVAALLGLADARYRLDDEEGALQAWLAATQAPETALAWQAWVALAGVRVRQGDLAGATRAYREAEGRAPPAERAAIASRLGWLSKELGQEVTAQRYFGRSRAGAMFSPIVTYGILALTVGIGLSTLLNPDSRLFWFELFALDKQALAAGEYWRLVSVTLVHGGVMHLAFNMYALFIVGPIVEAMYGRVLFFAFYVLTASVASVASYLFVAAPSVGASGAVFGLFGILLIANWRHKPAIARQARGLTAQIGILIVFNLALGFGLGGFGINIDNAAHVGGLIAGAWLGFAIVPRGVATLASFWQRPAQAGGGAGGAGAGSAGADGGGPAGLLRVAALLVVIIVVGVGLSLTPLWA